MKNVEPLLLFFIIIIVIIIIIIFIIIIIIIIHLFQFGFTKIAHKIINCNITN